MNAKLNMAVQVMIENKKGKYELVREVFLTIEAELKVEIDSDDPTVPTLSIHLSKLGLSDINIFKGNAISQGEQSMLEQGKLLQRIERGYFPVMDLINALPAACLGVKPSNIELDF